jgi:hypothetical protein
MTVSSVAPAASIAPSTSVVAVYRSREIRLHTGLWECPCRARKNLEAQCAIRLTLASPIMLSVTIAVGRVCDRQGHPEQKTEFCLLVTAIDLWYGSLASNSATFELKIRRQWGQWGLT